MGFNDETLIDAPVTPAPIFAYRALKAVFWGEENTPEQPLRQVDSISDKNPTNTKRTQSAGSPTRLTPSQKRRHSALAQSSPAKSILRTPGILTPRRALLKDLNVTFKDVRKSVSPEVLQKELHRDHKAVFDFAGKENQPPTATVTTITSRRDVKDTGNQGPSLDIFSIKEARPAASTTKATTKQAVSATKHVEQVLPATQSAPAAALFTEFDPEAYMRSTEKEMKKLIKYGQKMRDYAKRQDEENNKLRLLLDEMRQENDRLQRELGHVRKYRNENNNTSKSSAGVAEKDAPPALRQHSSTSRREDNNVPSSLSTKTHSSTRNPTKSNLTSKTQPDLLDLDTIHHHHNPQPTQPSSRLKRPFLPDHHDLNTDLEQLHPNPAPPSSSPAKKQRHLTQQSSPIHASKQTHIPLRPLPNDRLAAARARVQKKLELRKASSGSENHHPHPHPHPPPPLAAGDVHCSSSSSRVPETSLVDWASL